MGQETAEQRRALTRAIWQYPRDQATIIVIDNRLRNRPEEGKGTNVAIDPVRIPMLPDGVSD